MSLGAMTVMSYDIWKAKCAAEKKRLEAEGKTNGDAKVDDDQHLSSSPPARKRAHTFVARVSSVSNTTEAAAAYVFPGQSAALEPTGVTFNDEADGSASGLSRSALLGSDEPKEIPKVSPPNSNEKKGRYILLPTIPAMKVFVGEDAPAIVPTEPSQIPQESTLATSTAPLDFPTLSTAPALSLPASLPRPSPIAVTTPSFFHPLSTVAPPVAPTTTTAFGAGLTTDQLLATLLPPIVAPPSTSCASDVLALLRAQQSAQLAAALAVPSKSSMMPTSGSTDDLIQSLLAQSRQPIFSHSL
ncbi:unnamed protein product [Heligmosomoides polygyrus]|uniref:Flocculation protein FLO11-like n=1 Tax=Heligmosomoides polygyrus TaxID=6339 RepID=A0A3P7Z084_HELPZ|nr:unnamed protein product [Heligmosomoides polygyrus]